MEIDPKNCLETQEKKEKENHFVLFLLSEIDISTLHLLLGKAPEIKNNGTKGKFQHFLLNALLNSLPSPVSQFFSLRR